MPLVVGVTSHRNIPASEIEPIRRHVRDFLALLHRDFPQLPLLVLSALAEGGDRVVASEALACGARLTAVLPLPPALYVDDFGSAGSCLEFADLRARGTTLQLPLLARNTPGGIARHGVQRDRQYAAAGTFIASHCHILLAIWDGRPSDLLGGTAQVVRYHLAGIMPGLIESRDCARSLFDHDDESLLYHIACSRADPDSGVQSPQPPLQPLQVRWLSRNGATRAEAGMPGAFRPVFARMTQFNLDVQRYQGDMVADTAIWDCDGGSEAVIDDALGGLFSRADWLALHFQKRVLLAMRGIHVLAALMGIAFICYSDLPADLPYQETWIDVFIVLFASGLLLARLARQRDWHRKYIDYRALAEGLRVQRYWYRAGIAATDSTAFAHDNFLQKQDVELGWIRNVMRVASLRVFDRDSVPASALAAVIDEWVGAPGRGGQLDYYTRKTAERDRIHRFTQTLGMACLWAGISISVLLAVFHHALGADATTILVAVMGVLAVIAAARESYAYRKADKELVKQYRFMCGLFAGARTALQAQPDTRDQREILRALGEAALAEHAEWALMHRERPLEHGRL